MTHKNKITAFLNNDDNDNDLILNSNKKLGKKDHSYRYDVFDILESNMTEPFRSTPEGYLKGSAVIANTGIQSYRQKDGTILRELRTPEDVGNIDALESFKNIPITSGHPDGEVNSENAKKFQVGFTGSDVRFDGHVVSIDMTITDKKTIDNIKKYGKYAVSAGYNADIEYNNGFAFGNNPYDAIQKNIRANHIAVNIDRARAGDLARLKLRRDSNDAVYIQNLDVVKNKIKQPNINKEKKMSKLRLKDNVEFEVDVRVEDEFNKLKKDSKEKDAEISKLNAKKDSFEDENKRLKDEMKELKQDIPNQIKEAIKNRIALIDVAVKHEIEIKEDMQDAEIQKAIILKVFPNAKLEDKDEKYLEARFDSAVELLADKNAKDNKKTVLDIKVVKKQNIDADEKRKRYLKNLWKLNQDQARKYRQGIIDDEIKQILEEEV